MPKQHITNEQMQELKAKLLSEKERILKLKATIDSDSPVNDPDRLNDNAASDAEASEENRMITTEVMSQETGDMLTKIESALERMENGTYGLTTDGQEIPVERLLVDPTATTLVPKE